VFPQITIKKNDDLPAYRQIIDQIKALVHSGEIQVGDKIPPERELAEKLGLARGTVKKAYEELVRDHFIEVARGRGSFISSRQDTSDTSRGGRAVKTVDSMIDDLLALKFSFHEIKNLVDSKLAEAQERMQNFHVALVDCNPEALAIYEKQVVSLSHIAISRFLLGKLGANATDTLRPFDIIITTANHYKDVKALVPLLSDRIVQAIVSPRQESLIELARINATQKIGIVSRSEIFHQIIVNKLRDLHIDESRVSHLTISNIKQLADFITDIQVVIIPPGYNLIRNRAQAAQVQRFRESGGKIIEFDYQIERGSLLQIEERIRSRLQEK